MENKEFLETVKQYNDIVVSHICYEEGCLALFGSTDIVDVKAEIMRRGKEELLKKTTWSFAPSTADGYDEWVKHKVKFDELPKYLTKEAYLAAFKHDLTAMYQKDKNHEV